jgi:uncharacterized protein (TIGR03435 family)
MKTMHSTFILRFGTRVKLVSMGMTLMAGMLMFPSADAQAPVTSSEQGQSTRDQPFSYEVVSIKVNHSAAGPHTHRLVPDRFTMTNFPVNLIVEYAYNIKDYQLSGGPSWMNSERYDIEAKINDKAVLELRKLPRDEQVDRNRLMLQALLADRFKLTVHRETKDLPTYSLVVTKGGKLNETNGDCDPSAEPARSTSSLGWPNSPCNGFFLYPGHFGGRNVSMAALADALSTFTFRLVADNTNLAGKYNVTLDWTPAPGDFPAFPPGPDSFPQPDPNGPSLPAALQDQLGLKLESTRGPVDTLFIDHVENASED